MSMPQDLMQMLLGGGGNTPPFPQGQGMLAPSVPVSVTPQAPPQMGPEESAAMAMFTPPKDEEEVNQIHHGWKGWMEHEKRKPGFFKAMAAFGAKLAQPGGLAKNFTQAAAEYQNILGSEQDRAEEKGLQKFGILQQARGLDRQTAGQQAQLDLQKGAQKLDQDRFGLQKIESMENRSLMLENLGIKKREIVLAEAQARSSIQRDSIQNGLIEMQINKLKKDIDGSGMYELSPGDPPGQIFLKESMNARIKADPKLDRVKALSEVMAEYAAKAKDFQVDTKSQISPKDQFKEVLGLVKAQMGAELPGLAGKAPSAMVADAQAIVNTASGNGQVPTQAAPDPALIALAKNLQSEGYTLSGHDPGTRTVFVEKNGKIEKRTY